MDDDVDFQSQLPELYNDSAVQPYAPSQPVAPTNDGWDYPQETLTNREIAEYQNQNQQGLRLFGTPLPNATPQQLNKLLAEIASVFQSDMAGHLGHPLTHVNLAIRWFTDSMSKTAPTDVRAYHSYNLYQYANDPLTVAFANFAARNNFTPELMQSILYWMGELEKEFHRTPVMPCRRLLHTDVHLSTLIIYQTPTTISW